MQINDIKASYNVFGDFDVDVNFDKPIPEVIRRVVNEQANSRWRQLKPQIAADMEWSISQKSRSETFSRD